MILPDAIMKFKIGKIKKMARTLDLRKIKSMKHTNVKHTLK